MAVEQVLFRGHGRGRARPRSEPHARPQDGRVQMGVGRGPGYQKGREAVQGNARDDGGEIPQFDDGDQDSQHEDSDETPRRDGPDQAVDRGEMRGPLVEFEREEDIEHPTDGDKGEEKTREKDQDAQFGHSQAVKGQGAGDEGVFFHATARLQGEEGEGVRHEEEQEGGQVERQGPVQAVGDVPIEEGPAPDAQGLSLFRDGFPDVQEIAFMAGDQPVFPHARRGEGRGYFDRVLQGSGPDD